MGTPRSITRLLLLAAAVVLAGCTSGDEAATTTTTDTSTTVAAETTTSVAEEDGGDGGADAEETATDDTEPAAAPELVWDSCPQGECATLAVPLDHADPGGGTVELAVMRQPAVDTDGRIGSLVVHFGGPGADSSDLFADFAPFAGDLFPEFDIVAWDQRGMGDSAGLRCTAVEALPDEQQFLNDPADGVDDELTAAGPYVDALAQCAAEAGPVIDHLSTETTARDLEVLRAALGDDELTYLGFSYGTQIGWVHATLFPDSVRAMVLDGPAPPDTWTADGAVGQITGFQRTFDSFVERCAVSRSCRAREEGLDNRVERIAAELRENPIERPDGSVFDEVDLRLGVLGTLYIPAAFIGPDLDRWLAQTDDGDPSGFEEFAAEGALTSTTGAFEAVLCADGVEDDPAGLPAFMERLAEASPTFGRLPGYTSCDWFPAAADPPPALDTTGTPTLLVVGTTLDPATPYEDAIALDEQLADSRLLTYVGDGHTIVTFDDCIDTIVADYLRTVVAPPDGTACRAPDALVYGVALDPTTIEVLDLTPGSAAEVAGVEIGDLIIAADGTEVAVFDDIPPAQQGVTVVFTIDRDGTTIEIPIEPRLVGWG